ncbi:hypothetical protein Hanom_Chr00s086209g01796771 [Helianthus anomalus]
MRFRRDSGPKRIGLVTVGWKQLLGLGIRVDEFAHGPCLMQSTSWALASL